MFGLKLSGIQKCLFFSMQMNPITLWVCAVNSQRLIFIIKKTGVKC